MAVTETPPAAAGPGLAAGVFEPEETDKRYCEHDPCGREITGRHQSARYCSDEHKELAYRARKSSTRAPSSSPSTRPRGKPASVPVGTVIWGMLGYGIQLRLGEPVGPPVGRVMQFQAGDAGPRLERIGVKIGKALPFTASLSKGGQLAGDIAALLGPPLITAMIASGTIPRAVAEPLFIGIMRPLIADAMRQSAEAVETMSAMTEAEAEVIDTTRQFLAAIFGDEPEEGQHPG